jgi:Flp pilus assembly pilin Flp
MRALDEKGQGLTEYITLLVLISLVAVGATQSLGKKLREKISTATRHINQDINFNDVH